MIPPLLNLLAHQPELLMDHVEGYALLVREEWDVQRALWKRTAWLHVALMCCLSVGVGLLGVACMLWISQDALAGRTLAAMASIGLVPLCGAWLCWNAMQNLPRYTSVEKVLAQIRTDIEALRESSAP